jgi:anti-anti-sigma regulatory factor
MCSFNIEISQDGETVTLSPQGTLDNSLGFAFWQYCQPDQRHFSLYILDLDHVNELGDLGITWLGTFMRWAIASGAKIQLVNLTPEMEKCCVAAGSRLPQGWTSQARETVMPRCSPPSLGCTVQ